MGPPLGAATPAGQTPVGRLHSWNVRCRLRPPRNSEKGFNLSLLGGISDAKDRFRNHCCHHRGISHIS